MTTTRTATKLQRSLRVRLAVWNAIVVILTALVTLVVLRQGVQWALVHELDELLAEDASEIDLTLRQTPPDDFGSITDELARKAVGHRRHGWFVRLLDANGRPLWSSDRDHETAGSLAEARSTDAFLTLENRERALVHRTPENSHGVALLVVGEHLQPLRTEISHIDRLALSTAALVLLAAPLCGYWLAGRAAAAIGEITETASRLRPDHLNERLPLRGTGDELDRLAVTINGLLDRIAAFLEQKRDVLANAAHELRTPLAAIRSTVEVALNGNRSPSEYQELLEDVIDQSASLETLLNQLLLLSETEAERLKTQIETVALHELVETSAAMFQGVAETKSIQLRVTRLDAAQVAGNRSHLWQVVNNLIDNALKYSRANDRVDVCVSADDGQGLVELVVRDTGPGIAAEDLPLVFDRFFRADRSRTRAGAPAGAGLGLSICKAVVEAHGGKILCESTPLKGTAFTVELPLARPEPGDRPAEQGLMATT